MPYYFKLGQLPPKRHIQFRRPDGALYSEEVFGTEGFVGPTTTLYHIHPPTQVTGWKTLYSTAVEYLEADTMRMRHLKTAAMQPQGDPVTGRVVLFGNADCEMSLCAPADPMAYHFKNAMADGSAGAQRFGSVLSRNPICPVRWPLDKDRWLNRDPVGHVHLSQVMP